MFQSGDCDLVVYSEYADKLGILTANATTPYIIGFPDLSRTGPLVIDYPPGPTAGGIGDFWQRPLSDMGQTGPDQGRGAKYLILGPGQTVADTTGYTVVESPTFGVMVGTRILDPDPELGRQLLANLHIYPLSRSANPTPTRLIAPEGRAWSQVQPRGLAYWERLHAVLQTEPVEERDRMMMAMLAPLGLEKGKPFAPDARQKQLLIEGAAKGELMAKNLSFNKRFESARYRSDAHWDYVLTLDPSQEVENHTQLDERSAYFYEAVTASRGMTLRKAGFGQAYLGAYHDSEGEWLSGDAHYRLRVPANPPAKQFWSLTLYDSETRCLLDNEQRVSDKSSRLESLVTNPDGTVDIFMGPTPPPSGESNWIPTVPGRAWFAYFRLYAPTEPYLDASWALPDIERVSGR